MNLPRQFFVSDILLAMLPTMLAAAATNRLMTFRYTLCIIPVLYLHLEELMFVHSHRYCLKTNTANLNKLMMESTKCDDCVKELLLDILHADAIRQHEMPSDPELLPMSSPLGTPAKNQPCSCNAWYDNLHARNLGARLGMDSRDLNWQTLKERSSQIKIEVCTRRSFAIN